MTARPRRNFPVADDASRRTRGERRERPPVPTPGPAPARDWAAPLAAVTLVWIVLFAPLLFGGQRVVFGDAATFRPFPAYSRARWHESHVRTHWNPYVFMGLESVGSLADSRPQYLPDALLSLAERLHEPQPSRQLWLLLLHLAGTIAVLVLAHRLWNAPPWAAACGAIAWVLALPALGPFGHGFDAMFVSTAVLPIAVLATYVTFVAPRTHEALAAALVLAVALGISALHGHPQVLVYTAMLLVAFAAGQAWSQRRARRLVPWTGAVALALAIGASVWWPALLYSRVSSRGGLGAPQIPVEALARYSFAARDLLGLVWPNAVGFGRATYWGGLHVNDFPPYLGAVAAVLVALGVGAGTRVTTARFWWIVLGLSLLLTLGTNLGPIYVALHRVLPFWDRFRAPSYTMLVACLAFALLVARGAAVALERPPHRRFLYVVLGLAVAVGVAIAVGPLTDAYESMALVSRPGLGAATAHTVAMHAGWNLVFEAMYVLASTFVIWNKRWRHQAGFTLALAVALDGLFTVYPEFQSYVGPPSRVEAPAPPLLARIASADPHARVYVGAAAPVHDPRVATGQYTEAYTNAWSDWRVHNLTGNLGAFPAGWTLVMELGMTRSLAALAAWGVSWFDVDRAAPPIPGATPAAEDERARVYPLPGALGRLYAVSRVAALPDEPTVARAMLSPAFDPRAEALTADADAAGDYPGGASARIRWVEDGPERVAFDVEAAEPAYVVLADSHQPGWAVTIDGRAARGARVDLLVRGVAVPAGTHRVEWRYATPGRAAGVAVTRIALAAWAAMALALAASAVLAARRPRSGA